MDDVAKTIYDDILRQAYAQKYVLTQDVLS